MSTNDYLKIALTISELVRLAIRLNRRDTPSPQAPSVNRNIMTVLQRVMGNLESSVISEMLLKAKFIKYQMNRLSCLSSTHPALSALLAIF